MPTRLLFHLVNCPPSVNLNAYLTIADFVRRLHDPTRADFGFGSGSFAFRDREDAKHAEEILKRSVR